MKQYGYYGMGYYKSKIWYIYDRKHRHVLSQYTFKTKKEAIKQANKMNEE